MWNEFGCIRDKFNDREFLMRAYLPLIKLPKKIDWMSKMSPVMDQGKEGTCLRICYCFFANVIKK